MSKAQIDTNPQQLNTHFIYQHLSQSYWAKDRTMETIITCIKHSLNFGIYLRGQQIGYARVVTDYAVFAYIMDVFVDEAHRGRGYSKQLMLSILDHPELKQVKTWRLATTDAHELYRKFGFKPLNAPEKMMELIRP
jgi:GNAT superfamily N-acetyltransferase